MRETIIAVVLGACGSLIANAILFAIKRLRQWGASRFRVLLALNVTALAGGGVAFAYIAWDSIAHGTPLPVGGSAVVGCAFVALVVLGYLFCIELVKTTSVRATLARIDAILGQQNAHLENDPVLADALRSALTAIRQVVTRYGPFFDGGQHTVQEHLIDPRVRIGKRTIPLAWQVENILIGALTSSERFRRACVNSDEGASVAASESEYTWIIDPIDGGRHVARGLPLFTISVSLLRKGSSLLGVVFAPVTGELFFALKAKGAYLNAWENRLHVSNTDAEEAVLQVEFPNRDLMDKCSGDFEKQCESVRQIFSKVYRVRGLGLGSLGLAYVAKGAFDGYVTFTGTTLRNDVCAGLLLVEEAGGRVKEFEVPHVVQGNVRVLAANETVFRKIMAVVRG